MLLPCYRRFAFLTDFAGFVDIFFFFFHILCNCPAENVLPFLGFAGMHFISSSHVFLFRRAKKVLPSIGFVAFMSLNCLCCCLAETPRPFRVSTV